MSAKTAICGFTGLPIESCYHCNKPAQYQLRAGFYKGNRTVEVLKDGGSIHRYDEHFRFGSEKARLMLAALPVIREFAMNTDDDGNTTVNSHVVRDEANRRNILIWVELHPEFIKSSGMTIERPWLQMEELPLGNGARIGLGVQKAKAICALAQELKAWLADCR